MKIIPQMFRESIEDSRAGSDSTAPVGDIGVAKSSDSLSSSSSNCLAQADSHSRGLEDRTDRDSIVSSPARFGSADG